MYIDFVFVIFVEEFGFVGNLLVIVFYIVLVFIVMSIGCRVELLGKVFNVYLVYGISILIGL